MATNQLKQRIIFTEEADNALANILSKYGLEESDEQIIKKDEEEKSSYEYAIVEFTKKLTQGSILEKDLIASLQKELNIPQPTTEKIAKDVKEKLLPLVEKVSEEELKKQLEKEKAEVITGVEKLEETEEELFTVPIKPPIGLESVVEPTIKTSSLPKKVSTPETPSKIKETKKPPKKQEQDTYREPID